MASFKDVPKVPLEKLLGAAKISKNWRSMQQEIIGKAPSLCVKVDKFAMHYDVPFPYSMHKVLKDFRHLFLGYCRSIDDPDTNDAPPELIAQREYSLRFFGVNYSERESDAGEIKGLWQKVNGLYQLIRG